jgi:hypothetical protein
MPDEDPLKNTLISFRWPFKLDPPKVSRGGAPAKYDYIGAVIYACHRLYTDVTPQKHGAQAKIVGYLSEYLAQQPSGAPKSDTDLKKLARRIVDEFLFRE